MDHVARAVLDAGLDHICAAPADRGPVELIVRRPVPGEREVVERAELDLVDGLVGDNWGVRGARDTADGRAHPGRQVTLMSTRVAALIAGPVERWPLAGDQLYVDLDLSEHALPAGTRLAVGSALLEMTGEPHRGCAKFVERFGADAGRFVNTPATRSLRLRGANARVLVPGALCVGDDVVRLPSVG
jgi:MOSC domain-containing protein YiiM